MWSRTCVTSTDEEKVPKSNVYLVQFKEMEKYVSSSIIPTLDGQVTIENRLRTKSKFPRVGRLDVK